MIVDNGKYYLYRHIRLDKNEPFYMGVGTKPEIYGSYRTEYRRGYDNKLRNRTWKGIASRTEYRVEILLESDNYDFIEEKETEFIELYGRIINKSGTLANYSVVGKGITSIKGELNKKSIPVFQYDSEGNFVRRWASAREIRRELGHWDTTIIRCCRGLLKGAYKQRWFFEFKGGKIEPYKKDKSHGSKKVYQYKPTGELVSTYPSCNSVKKHGFDVACVSRACLNEKKTYRKFKWSYNYKQF